MNKVGWGILSTGRITHQFAHDFQWVGNGELKAVASRSQDSADDFAAQYSIPTAYDSYQAMLADPAVDAVYIATPHTLHYQNTLDALQAGKHVLCEKPFTVTPRETEQLISAAADSGQFVMEAMWTYFLPAVRQAQQWLAEGRIGRLRQIKADFGYPQLPFDPNRREYNAELAGGCLLEMGIYPVALAWLIAQADPDDMQVYARFAPNGVEDEVAMLFRYGDNETGITATLGTSFRSKLQNWAYLIGEEGYIAIPDFWRASEAYLYHLDDVVEHFQRGRESFGLNYEAVAAGEDILAGRQQNAIMPLATSLRLQQHMAEVRDRF